MIKKLFLLLLLANVFTYCCISAGANQNIAAHITYDIHVTLDHNQRMLHGKEHVSWHNHSNDTISDMRFHLYWNAFKNENSAMAREYRQANPCGAQYRNRQKDGEWGWIRIKRIRLEDGTDVTPSVAYIREDLPVHPDDQTVMQIIFPQPLQPGETVKLIIDFESKIPRTVARAGYYANGYFFGQWYPKPGVYEEGKGWNCHQYHLNSEFFADFADFTVHMTVPADFVIGASGKEVSRVEDTANGTVTYSHYQKNIHDFAWTADPDYVKSARDFIADNEVAPEEYEALSRQLRVPVEQLKLNNVQMILLLNPEHRGQEDRHFKALRMAIKYYGLWYGPYPYETITLVDPPFRSGCGGMEYPTLITGGSRIFLPKKPGSLEQVIIHEFGHNYWYGLVASNEFEEAWLDEGINSYCDGKVMAAGYGPAFIPLYIAGIPYSRYLTLFKGYKYVIDRASGLLGVKQDPIVTNSWAFFSPLSYGVNVYGRAAITLKTLERILGPDVMARVLRAFQGRYRYQHPHTADFIEVVNEVSGRDMQWFFTEFFHKANVFDYAVASLHSEKMLALRGVFDDQQARQEVTKQMARAQDKDNKEARYFSKVVVKRLGEARLGGDVPLKIKVVFEDGSQVLRYWDGRARWVAFTFIRPAKITYAQVDPEHCFLFDANMTNNSLRRKPDHTAAVKWSTKLHFLLQNLMHAISMFS